MLDNLLGEVKGFFNIFTIIEIVLSLLYTMVGLIFFTSEEMSKVAVGIIIGIFIMVSGVSFIYSFIRRSDIVLFNNNMLYGIITIIIGLIACIFSSVLNIFVGIFLLIVGIQKINYGILLKRYNESSWLLTLVVGILLMVIAVITFITSADNIPTVVGICAMGYGLINIVNMLLLRKRAKYFIEW